MHRWNLPLGSLSLTVSLAGIDWAQVNPGSSHPVACKTNGSIWAWGDDQFGQVGLTHRVVAMLDELGASHYVSRHLVRTSVRAFA